MIGSLSLLPIAYPTDTGGASATPSTATTIPKLIGEVVTGHGYYRLSWNNTKAPYTVYYNDQAVDRGANNNYIVPASIVLTNIVITDGYGQRYTFDVRSSLPGPQSLPPLPAPVPQAVTSSLSKPVTLFGLSLPLYGWLGVGAGTFYILTR